MIGWRVARLDRGRISCRSNSLLEFGDHDGERDPVGLEDHVLVLILELVWLVLEDLVMERDEVEGE